jgi:hypothetical protein
MVQRADRRGTVYALLITSIISLCNSATLNVHTQQSSLFELNGELKLVGVDDIYIYEISKLGSSFHSADSMSFASSSWLA